MGYVLALKQTQESYKGFWDPIVQEGFAYLGRPPKVDEPSERSLIRVDRSSRLEYPFFKKSLRYPHYENVGPPCYSALTTALWLDDNQSKGKPTDGHSLQNDLERTGLLRWCASLHDLLEIKRNYSIFVRDFPSSSIVAWKSVIVNEGEVMFVPCLKMVTGRLYIRYLPLGFAFGTSTGALLLPE